MRPTNPMDLPANPLVAPVNRPSLHGIEYRFGLLLAIFGVAFVFLLPPVQVPDENAHFLHAYDVAQGHMLPAHAADGWAGTVVPANLMPIIDRQTRFWWHPQERWTRQDIQEMLDLRFSEESRPVSIAHVSIYNFFPYLPQAAGLRLARWLDLRPLLVFYAGRLGSLAFGILCVVLAVRLAPIGKLLFGAIALLPMSVQQFGSLSADAPTLGLSLVLVAALLRLALSSDTNRPPAWTIGLLLLLTFAVALTKFPYTVLVLLYFGIPAAQVGSRRRYWMIGMLVLAVAAAGLATSFGLTGPYTLDSHDFCGEPISKSSQIHFILTHPLRFVRIFLNSVAERGIYSVLTLFQLGILDTPLHPLTSMGYVVFLAVLGLADGKRQGMLPWRLWSVGVAALFLSVGMILTALYVWWTPLASPLIAEAQGRYYIPLLPLFFLLLRNGGIQVAADARFLARMSLAICGIFLTYACVALANRYYFLAPPYLFSPPLLLGLGFVTVLLCWVRSRWLLGRESEMAVPSTLDAENRSRSAA